eukprot:Hpha_TRINITY_DN9380_c0_g1::TRINITY_DN9380_c0_g1_i1::g.26081::m.26081
MSQQERDYLLLHGLHYLFDELAKAIVDTRPQKAGEFAKQWLQQKGDASRQTETAVAAVKTVTESLATGQPTAGAANSDAAVTAMDQCVAHIARALAGLPPHHASRAELIRLRTRLADERRILLKWKQSFPKEADGSIRIPGGDSLSYKDGLLRVGDFAAFQVTEDEDETVRLLFVAGSDGPKAMQVFDEDEELKDMDEDVVKQAQAYAHALLTRMGLGADQDVAAAGSTWEELTRWVGGDKHLAGMLRIHVK